MKYNRLIAHIFANYPATNFQTPCKIGEYPATTIERVALSYVAHLEHHLRQLVGDGLPYSGLPWPFDE